MTFFRSIHLSKKRRYLLTILVAFFVAFFLFLEYIGFYSIFSNQTETSTIRGNPDERLVALTFNISWGDEKIIDILTMLKQHEQHATFFVSGEWAERHPHIIEKIIKDEHELGMLGYRYLNYLDDDTAQIRKDLIFAKQLFDKLNYSNMKYVRPPNGDFSDDIISLVEQLDLELIRWRVNANDVEGANAEMIADNVIQQTEYGDIILFHASDSAKYTADALDVILTHFKNKKISPVTVSELLSGVYSEQKLVE